jgi:hypothetical protein
VPIPEALQPSHALIRASAAVAGTLALSAALFVPAEMLTVSPGEFAGVALGSIVVLLAIVLVSSPWSAAGAYAVIFWCFHFGFIAVLGAGLLRTWELPLWDQLWVLGPYGGDAAVIAFLGFVAFGSTALVVRTSGTPEPPPPSRAGEEDHHRYGALGSALVVGAVMVWCAVVFMTGGVAGFVVSYADYLHATGEFAGLMSAVWLAVGCGLVLSVTGRRDAWRTAALAAFGGFALLALPIGLRGEVLFPTAAALVAAARCGRALSPARAGVFALGLLVLIPAVREIRAAGLQGLSEVVLDVRLFEGVAEMGRSLHPVEKVVRWRAEGEPLDMGASYWAPIERAAARVLPGLPSSAAEDDMRIMNVLVTDRVGAIGFSPVAEAYRNFGAAGVVIVLGLLGAGLGAMDRIRDPHVAVLALATLYVPLLVNVRNSFVSVPLQCAAGLLLIAALRLARHVSGALIHKPYASAPYVRSEI